MRNAIPVPDSLYSAGRQVRLASTCSLERMPKIEFIRTWCSIAYLFPGLHPDGFDEDGSGWPRVLKRFAAEAWRRNDAGELRDEEMYPSDAAWSGIFDRIKVTSAEATKRRVEIAMTSNFFADA
jgi:hypothetical protein